jgi:hypothetical protein
LIFLGNTPLLKKISIIFCSLLICLSAQARLEGSVESLHQHPGEVLSEKNTVFKLYTIKETQLNTGTVIREYINKKKMVFALSWQGPIIPDLQALLGTHFDSLKKESQRIPKAGRSALSVNRPEVIIHSAGHMRAFQGQAWVPSLLPHGFSTDEIQ